MSERRCYGCMRTTTAPVCEHCNWPADGNNDLHQLPVGTVLQGKYLIGRVLGQGGFGITYLGWDMNLDIRVCIKEFYPSSTVNRDVTRSTVVNCNTTNTEGYYAACLERFLREGKALARFRNVPQIVGIHDFFQLNNTAYMVMEFVSGIDLAKYVRKRGGRLHMDEILKILKPVMEALQLVHDAGIIHRDISPDNIMLEPREGAKLLDFGAVRNVEHPDAEKELTHATEAILKNGFAPMEQYVGKGSLGPWTDVHAMSATIYYCLTGRIPEDSPVRLMEGTPLDWTGAQGLTEHQKAVLEQGMAPRAKDRIASVRELMDKLYTVEAAPVPVPTPQPIGDPQEAEIINDLNVDIPPTHSKKPGPAPVPVVDELASPKPEQPVISPAPLKAAKNRKSLWIIAAAAVLVLAVLVKISQEPQKDVIDPVPDALQVTAPLATEPTAQPTEPSAPPLGPPAWVNEPWAMNVLRYDPLSMLPINRTSITSVTFLDSTASAPSDATSVGAIVPQSVLGWVSGTGVFFAADGGINGEESCQDLFGGCENLEVVVFGNAFHTEVVTSMEFMFRRCHSLRSADVENLNTGNVKNMYGMFDMHQEEDHSWHFPDEKAYNRVLLTLDVSNWDMSNVTDTSFMFNRCAALEGIDVSKWDMSHVKTMENMFAECADLHALDVSRWDTSRAKRTPGMFIGCTSLQRIDLGSWDTTNIQVVGYMFSGCPDIEVVGVSQWDTASILDYDHFAEDHVIIDGKPWKSWFEQGSH